MTTYNHNLLPGIAALLLCAASVACSQDEPADDHGTAIPSGEMPVELMSPQRATVGTLNLPDGTAVAVRIGDIVKEYKYTAIDGTLTTDGEPFYWNNTAEVKDITAWYPYSDTYPTAWTVKADQRSLAAYRASDLTAGSLSIAFADREDAAKRTIAFKHQMSKVVVNLTADGVTLNDDVDVRLLNLDGVDDGTSVTPFRPSDRQSYMAIVGTQTIAADRRFIRVSVDGNDYYYTPAEAKELKAGLEYTYNITVRADGIDVSEVAGGTWYAEYTRDITGVAIISRHRADELKAGDYLYTDGTTSDGGLRIRYANGSGVFADPLPQPDPAKTVCGIVFWSVSDYVAPTRVTPANLNDDRQIVNLDSKDIYCKRGLAVALHPAAADVKWQEDFHMDLVMYQHSDPYFKYNYTDIATNTAATGSFNKVLGYQNTLIINRFNADCDNDKKPDYLPEYAVIPGKAVAEYAATHPTPQQSTGWYVPSIKELHMLCHRDVDDIVAANDLGYDGGRTLVNTTIKVAGGTPLNTGYYWSSTEAYPQVSDAYAVYFFLARAGALRKDVNGARAHVVAVCAF